ncbi:MAG: thermonuclease family protein [Candidatus Omnitrophota bacterium]
MPRKPKELKYLQVAALIIASIIYLGIRNFPAVDKPAQISANESRAGLRYVTRVVDGDTIQLSGGEKVRLIGVDTPEKYYGNKLLRDSKRSGKDIKTIQALGTKASDWTKGLCLNKRVRLEYDVERHDRYGRTLAYVYLEDGTFVNARIMSEGYGQIMTIPPNVKYASYFRKLERAARAGKRGLWEK